MASSMALFSRRLYRTYLPNQRSPPCCQMTRALFSTDPSAPDSKSDAGQVLSSGSSSESDSLSESDSESFVSQPSSSVPAADLSESPPESTKKQLLRDRVLEDGVDVGIYKAVIVGRIGQRPLQKTLKNGRMITLTSVGTGGMRNERRPFADEEPREYADRTAVQWHRVAVYHQAVANILMKNAQPGVLVYMEGNLETKMFTDPVTGLVRRLREIAIRRNGRVVFLGDDCEYKPPEAELRSVGYY